MWNCSTHYDMHEYQSWKKGPQKRSLEILCRKEGKRLDNQSIFPCLTGKVEEC